MVLGLMYGETRPGDAEERSRSNLLNDMMMERFKEKNGSCICNEILGYDITTPEGLKKVREKGLFSSVCPKMVANAVDILEEIIKARD